jgi:hypothetical protein
MPGLGNAFFNIDVGHAEGLASHKLGIGKRLLQLGLAAGHPHADAAAAATRLDHDRVAHLAGNGLALLQAVHQVVAARHHRHASTPHLAAGQHLVAHKLKHP